MHVPVIAAAALFIILVLFSLPSSTARSQSYNEIIMSGKKRRKDSKGSNNTPPMIRHITSSANERGDSFHVLYCVFLAKICCSSKKQIKVRSDNTIFTHKDPAIAMMNITINTIKNAHGEENGCPLDYDTIMGGFVHAGRRISDSVAADVEVCSK